MNRLTAIITAESARLRDRRRDEARLTVLRAEWRRLGALLADPAIELDCETFGPILDVYTALVAAGESIDPIAEGMIQQGIYQLCDASAGFSPGERLSLDRFDLRPAQRRMVRALATDEPHIDPEAFTDDVVDVDPTEGLELEEAA